MNWVVISLGSWAAMVSMMIGAIPSGPASLELDEQARRHLSRFKGVHPRIYLSAEEMPLWRERIGSSHRWLWEIFARRLERMKGSQPPRRRWNRGDGNELAHLAFAWAMTQDGQLLAAAKRHLLALAERDVWDRKTDLLHGHLLCGAAVAYDWLWSELSQQERQKVARQLARQAELQFRASTVGRGWWRNTFLQNHGHVNLCGLAFAGAVLYGEEERAERWLALADWFFSNVFEVSNPDGTSIEGLSYGAYALEFCLRYAELSRRLLGRDYYDSAWLKHWPEYLIHSTLPVMVKHNWAMTFGDSPRAAESHLPVHSMFRIAAEYRDGRAQWIAKRLLEVVGQFRSPHLCILWYDPSVEPIRRDRLPSFWHLSDTGQVMMRSDWGPEAVMLGMRCGPWHGHRLDGQLSRDLGAAHQHPDINSFQIFAYGQWLAIDPLYTLWKRTSNHNTVVVNGFGQLGEAAQWFSGKDALTHRHRATVRRAESHASYDYVAGDATQAYHPGLGLKRFVRHIVFVKPDVFVMVDDLVAGPTGVLYRYQYDQLLLKNMGVWRNPWPCVGPTGRPCEAGLIFQHESGSYDIDFSYYDNSPGIGVYELLLGQKVVDRWRHNCQETDLHNRVFHGLQIGTGQYVGVRGRPMGPDAKFLKFDLYDRSRPRPVSFDWLLHAEPDAAMESVRPGLVRITKGGVYLDVHLVAPEAEQTEIGRWPVRRGRSFRETMRLRIRPRVRDGAAVMVTVLQACRAGSRGLEELSCQKRGRRVTVRFKRAGRPVVATVELDNYRARVELPAAVEAH